MPYYYEMFLANLHGVVDEHTHEVVRLFTEELSARAAVGRATQTMHEALKEMEAAQPNWDEKKQQWVEGTDVNRVEAVNQLTDTEIKLIADRMSKGEDVPVEELRKRKK